LVFPNLFRFSELFCCAVVQNCAAKVAKKLPMMQVFFKIFFKFFFFLVLKLWNTVLCILQRIKKSFVIRIYR